MDLRVLGLGSPACNRCASGWSVTAQWADGWSTPSTIQAGRLNAGTASSVVGIANARDGFVYDQNGIDLPAVRGLASAGGSLTELPHVRHWPVALDGTARHRGRRPGRGVAARPPTANPASAICARRWVGASRW